MVSKLSISYLRAFIVLCIIIAIYCFPQVATAQSEIPRLIPLAVAAPVELSSAPIEEKFSAHSFVVYGRAGAKIIDTEGKDNIPDPNPPDPKVAARLIGITQNVEYRPIPYALEDTTLEFGTLERMPNLEQFFDFGGTVELLTTDFSVEMHDIVMSELMWGIDQGLRDKPGFIRVQAVYTEDDVNNDPTVVEGELKVDENNDPVYDNIPIQRPEEAQWFELYNTTDREITAEFYLLFSPFVSHPNRETVRLIDTNYKVIDALSNLLLGKWSLPGKSGRRPNTAFVSAYRVIDYDTVENNAVDRKTQLSGIPFGSYPDSWEKTPDEGRRNTLLLTPGAIALPYIATPGTKHVPEGFTKSLRSSSVNSNKVVINEVRNDTSRANIDWIELKNVSSRAVDLETWEVSIVTETDGKRTDSDLVDLPAYELQRGEILLIVNEHPHFTAIANGIDVEEPAEYLVPSGLNHKYFVSDTLNLPNDKKFTLLLRSEHNQNGQDEAIEDYAGNGFFSDGFSLFWPRTAQRKPIDVADFGERTFTSRTQSWARIRYEKDDGHHKEAWQVVEAVGGIGYAPDTDLRYAPGTPGYENDTLKTQLKNKISPAPEVEYDDGEISISEIMYDTGINGNGVQWIELYNSSLTQAIDLKGWEFEIRNLADEEGVYVEGSFIFEDAVILPNQVLLLVSERAATDLPDNRIYDLYQRHRRDLNLARWPTHLLSPTAFYVKLTDTANPNLRSDDIIVDEVGNLKLEGTEQNDDIVVDEGANLEVEGTEQNDDIVVDEGANLEVEGTEQGKEWDLPKMGVDRRRSITRLYGGLFKPDKDGLDGKPSSPDKGLTAEGWRRSTVNGESFSFYGMRDDVASPGYRLGGPVPVTLSSFRPVRTETGGVRIKWRTESELENAGFNLLRAQTRDADFTIINVKGLIPGHGTSSEQHLYTYTDTTAKPDTTYYYRIEDVSLDGARQTLATVRLKGDISAAQKLTTNWGTLKLK